jgi:hypothetical protein
MYNECVQVLGVHRRVWCVEAYQRLPEWDVKFDIVTAFMICFNNHKQADLWGVPEWHFFLKDVAKHQCRPDGRILLDLNPENDGSYYDDKLLRFFEGHGGEVSGRRVHFGSLAGFRKS